MALVEAYAKAQGMWRDDSVTAVYSESLSLDMATVVPSLAGPKPSTGSSAIKCG